MRTGEQVTHYSGVLGLSADVLADPDDAGGLLCRGAGKINSGKADLVGLGRTGAQCHGLILAGIAPPLC
jgi:hypothetical protein